jgi:hypothetical protein
MPVIDKLRERWQAEQFDQLADSYSPDALLDIYVPASRMQYRGTESIVAFWRLDFGRPRQFRFMHWTEHATPWGSVIETSVIDEPTSEYFRWVNLIFVVDDQIVHHVVYCTGAWTSDAAKRWEPDVDIETRSLISAGLALATA